MQVLKSFTTSQKSGALMVALGKDAMFSLSYNGITEDEALTEFRGRYTRRHCEEQSEEAIHSAACVNTDCFAEPSGAHSRDPLARNDGCRCRQVSRSP
jgi:hypothetical protein